MGALDVGKSKLGKCVLIVSELSLEALTPVINQDKYPTNIRVWEKIKKIKTWIVAGIQLRQ